jgi:hypothetical protein
VNLASGERGVVLIQVGLALVVLLGFSAFAIDYGVLWVARGQAQNAADAGALAAATALAFDNMVNPDAAATRDALALATNTPVWRQPPVAEVETCADPYSGTCPTVPGLPTPESRTSFSATVRVYRDSQHANALPTYLASLFGVTNQSVRAQATATVAPANVATCAWPLAMPDDWLDLSPADPGLPLPALCAQATDPRCKPFSRYRYPAGPPAVVDSPDQYVAPPFSSDDFATGYYLLELDEPMKPSSLFEPQVFVDLLGPDPDNPLLWRPARRSSFAAVRIGGGGFLGSLTSCNPQSLHFGDYLPLDTAATWAQATNGASQLNGQDGGASWADSASRIRGSCAMTGSCGSTSPRLVVVPMFDPELYDSTRAGSPACGGLPCIRIVNFVGFFIDSSTDATRIVGHLSTYPGKAIDMTKPFVGYKWAFLRTAVLTR